MLWEKLDSILRLHHLVLSVTSVLQTSCHSQVKQNPGSAHDDFCQVSTTAAQRLTSLIDNDSWPVLSVMLIMIWI